MALIDHPPFKATLWGCALALFANILGQLLTAYRTDSPYVIDWIPVFRYLLFTVISTAPNFMWQQFLESTFPQYVAPQALHPKKSDEKPLEPQFSVRNTVIKLVLDQTIGAVLNTLAFSTFFGAMRAAMAPSPRITAISKATTYWVSPGAIDFSKVDFTAVWEKALDELYPIMKAGWRLWPAVSLLNFTLVKTVEMRGLVGGLAGIAWGIYMSIVASG